VTDFKRKNRIPILPAVAMLFALLSVFLMPVNGSAQEAYVIGSGDILEILFWQDNTLDANVRVTVDGKISLDIIGEVSAAGLTTVELEREIIRQMSRYNKSISQTVVRVTEYNSQHVFVSGQIRTPGKYTFEVIPDLWTIINEAGGVSELGDLSRVLIIRGNKNAGEVEVVNVGALVTTGRLKDLPKLRAGDTVEIPRTVAGLPASTLSQSQSMRNLFYVVGEVNAPGALNLENNIDILDAIALAGGPTQEADLKKAKIISKDGIRTQIKKINLNKYTSEAVSGRVFIRPEDVILLPRRSTGFLGMGTTEWVAIIGGISTIVLMADALNLIN
jgi:polysaccharide export outer membrane protein